VHRRWQKERLDRSFREDVRDLEAIRDLSSLQLMADMLPERVASPLSLNALREDLEVSHRAVTHWVDILDRPYYAVRVPPFTSKRVRSLRKMPKAHLWDWTLVADRARRLENLVALHLLKLCNLWRIAMASASICTICGITPAVRETLVAGVAPTSTSAASY